MGPGKVFREVGSQDRERKTKSDQELGKGACGLEVPGSQPSLIIPASLSGQEASLHRPLLPWHAWAWGLLLGLQPSLTGGNGLHPPNPSEHTSAGTRSPCPSTPGHPLALLKSHPRVWQSWVSPSWTLGPPGGCRRWSRARFSADFTPAPHFYPDSSMFWHVLGLLTWRSLSCV